MEIGGKIYKQYRGMGSLAAMRSGSAARYGHDKNPTLKVAAEGIEALKEVVGPVDRVLGQLVGGIQSGMGYLGAANLEQLRAKARYIRVSPAGMKRSRPARRGGIEDGALSGARAVPARSAWMVVRGLDCLNFSFSGRREVELVGTAHEPPEIISS